MQIQRSSIGLHYTISDQYAAVVSNKQDDENVKMREEIMRRSRYIQSVALCRNENNLLIMYHRLF